MTFSYLGTLSAPSDRENCISLYSKVVEQQGENQISNPTNLLLSETDRGKVGNLKWCFFTQNGISYSTKYLSDETIYMLSSYTDFLLWI